MSTTTTDPELDKLPYFDRALHDEAVELYVQLSPDEYCRQGQLLLNGPSTFERLDACAGVRALGTSRFLYNMEGRGVTAARLFYFVAITEGILMPYMQPMISLAEALGHKGPNKGGKFQELERAKENIGPAMKFLGTHAQPIFTAKAPTLGSRFVHLHTDNLSKFRNAIAHFKFRFECSTISLLSEPSVKALPQGIRDFAFFQMDGLRKLLGFPGTKKPEEEIDYATALVRYEEDLDKPVTKKSRSRTFAQVREILNDMEKVCFSLMFAYPAAGKRKETAGEVKLGDCERCKEGKLVILASAKTAPCPACGETLTIS